MPEVNVDILTAGDGQVVHDPLFSPVRREKLVTFDSATENA